MGAIECMLPFSQCGQAKVISQKAKKKIDEAEKEYAIAVERFHNAADIYTKMRNDIQNQIIEPFGDLWRQVKNADFKGAALPKGSIKPDDVIEKYYQKNTPKKTPEFTVLKTGAPKAFFASLAVAVLVFAIVLVVGALTMGMSLSELSDPQQIKNVLTGIGSAVGKAVPAIPLKPDILGLVTALVVALLAANFVAMRIVYKRSRKSLLDAKATNAEVEEVCAQRYAQCDKMNGVSFYLETLNEKLTTLQLYMQEHAAISRRIMHIEGLDYSAYSARSKEAVQTAVAFYTVLRSILATNTLDANGDVTLSIKSAEAKGVELMDEQGRKWLEEQ